MSKRCLITGSNGALGTAMAQYFNSKEYEVYTVDRSVSSNSNNFYEVDLSNWEKTKPIIDDLFASAGEIDTVIHCAGGFCFSNIDEISNQDMEFLVSANLLSTGNLLRAVVPNLKKQSSSSVFAIGANAGLHPGPGMGFYAATKAAVHALVQSCARENFEHGIRVNAILPSVIDTPANRRDMPDADPGDWVSPGDIASLIYELSDESKSKLTGALIPLAGKLV